MRFLTWRPLLPLLAATVFVGCVAPGGSGSNDVRTTEITVSATFEKRTLGPSGFGAPEQRPARNMFVEICRDSDGSTLKTAYLDTQGQAVVTVPLGTRVYARAFARVRVPDSKTGDAVLYGSVKNARTKGSYADVREFNAIADVSATSTALTTSGGDRLSIYLPSSHEAAGAFNIADQMVTFGRGVNAVEPGLKLPSLHAFWSTQYLYTDFPLEARDNGNYVLQQQDTKRAVFQFPVRRGIPGGPDAGADEFNDTVLVKAMAHLLFADFTYSSDGSKSFSLLRRDNENVYVVPQIQSEPAVAFVNGYCDFLAGAFLGTRTLYEVDDQGRAIPFRLDDHAQFAKAPWQGEFYRSAVAVSLYGIWRNALGGDTSGLTKLWTAAAFAQGPGEYNNTLLACYPSFLAGLKNALGAGSASWSATLSELAKESIQDVTHPSYLASGTLWSRQYAPFTVNGGVRTHASAIYFDRDQSAAYAFTQSYTGTRHIRLDMTGGQDLYLELFDTKGLYTASWNSQPVGTRQLDLANLPPGEYLVRVRAGNTSADRNPAMFTLAVQ